MKHAIWMMMLLAGAACSGGEPGVLPLDGAAVDVTVSSGRRASAGETFPAVFASEREAQIATRMSGTVERVLVEVGSAVQAGEAVVMLDAVDVRARVDAARAAARLAETSHRRVASLASDGAASQHELDQVTAKLEAARAGLAEAEAQQAYAVVKAPFTGVVTQRWVDAGDLAGPGAPLLTVVEAGALKVVADLPGHRAGQVRRGDQVWVEMPGGARLDAVVSHVVPALGTGSRSFRVEVRLDQSTEAAMPGGYARLHVKTPGEGPRWLPADAVVERGQLRGVYSVEADTLRLRWVRLGKRRGEAFELLAGPAGEMSVVRRPPADLFDGRPVASVREEAFEPGEEQDLTAASATTEVPR